jgi:hypothetical protein
MLLAQFLILLQLHVESGPNDLLIMDVDLVESNIGVIPESSYPGFRFDMFLDLLDKKLDEDFLIEVRRCPDLVHLQEGVSEQERYFLSVLGLEVMKSILEVVVDLHLKCRLLISYQEDITAKSSLLFPITARRGDRLFAPL